MTRTFRVEPGSYGKRVVVTSSWHTEIANYIRAHNIKELYLNYAWGWKGADLSFLRDLQGLEALLILDWNIQDVSPIHLLHDLRFLEVSTYCKTKIDFDEFPQLEDCRLEWRRGSESLFRSKSLKRLWLNEYSGNSSDPLGELVTLESLSLGSAPLREVVALSRLPELKFLGLYHLGRLRSLAGIGNLFKLDTLDIEGCRRIGSIFETQGLLSLKSLRIADCGRIESLKPIGKLERLESVVFYESTNIADGDLSPLLKLKFLSHVAFRDRPHYSHALVEFPTRSLPGKRGLRA